MRSPSLLQLSAKRSRAVKRRRYKSHAEESDGTNNNNTAAMEFQTTTPITREPPETEQQSETLSSSSVFSSSNPFMNSDYGYRSIIENILLFALYGVSRSDPDELAKAQMFRNPHQQSKLWQMTYIGVVFLPNKNEFTDPIEERMRSIYRNCSLVCKLWLEIMRKPSVYDVGYRDRNYAIRSAVKNQYYTSAKFLLSRYSNLVDPFCHQPSYNDSIFQASDCWYVVIGKLHDATLMDLLLEHPKSRPWDWFEEVWDYAMEQGRNQKKAQVLLVRLLKHPSTKQPFFKYVMDQIPELLYRHRVQRLTYGLSRLIAAFCRRCKYQKLQKKNKKWSFSMIDTRYWFKDDLPTIHIRWQKKKKKNKISDTESTEAVSMIEYTHIRIHTFD